MTEKEKIHSGEIYQPMGQEILDEQLAYLDRMDAYNAIPRRELQKREQMLPQLFAEVGEGCYVESPFYANWGGHHVHLGRNVYTNYGVTFVDDTHIYIGDYTMIGPNTVLATAAHPLDPGLRRKGLQYNLSVRIGKNCWLGAGVVVLPGVTIGDNCVIGAGSVVTRDIPPNVVAVGNPCRVLREIGEADRVTYRHGRNIPEELLDGKIFQKN
ncbi:MAG: sugar O-acetyltransferase [Candidatus Faecousia sp.]|nr:sugar O-acetyltransferase [Clostridiales bacterium]MDY6180996.1 sugar O-acetyltransferase [Candidatus Faecousia sp.]